ncbi:MAG: 3-keto-5-aminohexanoate cleavage protein [Pseudomonadales bacterium]
MNSPGGTPVFIAVAPNGARHGKSDHPGVPISPRELAETAVTCAEAGATMIHLHVRDEHGRHSLEPTHYRPAIREVRHAVGDAMLIQVTSEAAGIYTPQQQIRLIEALVPDGVSLAIREIFANAADSDAAARFLESLRQQRTLLQFILYDREDVQRYQQLIANGVIPDNQHNVLYVLGRYSNAGSTPEDLHTFIAEFNNAAPWMACAFGRQAVNVLTEAASSGGHVRIGFENGWFLPDGSVASDNAALVRTMAARVRESGHRVANVADARALF